MGISMNKYKRLIISTAVLVLISCTLMVAQEREKRAQTVMKFLSVTNDARVSALGDAITAVEGNSFSMFFNPAGMARQKSFMSMSLGQTQWIADINYLYGSASFTPFDRKFGVFGLTVSTVDYGDIIGTRIQGKSFVETGTFSPTAMSFGVGYAKELTDKFSIGGNVKYVRQSLGSHNVQSQNSQEMIDKDFSANVMAFDLGILYKTGYKNLNFGMSIRNFSQEVKFEEENSQLPLTFKIGLSFDFADLMAVDREDHSLLMAVDAVHPRDYYEQVNVGFEYSFMESFSVRAGYVTPHDEMGINAGFGLKQEIMSTEVALDYAYTSFGVFDNVHRFTLKFAY
jgi:hypothetical protein